MEEKRKPNMQIYDPESVLAPLQRLNLMDDFLFDAATVDLETCKIIVELSLGIRIRQIAWKEGQKVIHNLPGNRGIRMDFYVEDDRGQVFDVEMQKRNEGNIPKRTRFYQALIDAPMLKSGERGFDRLKPAYIVVICGFDLYGYGLYRYTFDNRCKEVPELVMGDECQKIHQIKTSEEIGVSYMKMEERDRLLRDEGLRKGRAEGRAEGKAELISIIRRKASRGVSVSAIADLLETECGEIEKILELIQAYPDWTDLQVAKELLIQKEKAEACI